MTNAPSFLIEIQDPPAKKAIMLAALDLFVARGIEGTSIRDVAEKAGYSNPALYKHFASKEELAFALFERCYGEMSAWLDRTLADTEGPFPERFEKLIAAYTGLLDKCPQASIYVNENLAAFWPKMPAAQKKRTLITRYREILATGRKEGAVTNGQEEELLVVLVAGTLAQFSRMIYLGGLARPAGKWAKPLSKLLLRSLS